MSGQVTWGGVAVIVAGCGDDGVGFWAYIVGR